MVLTAVGANGPGNCQRGPGHWRGSQLVPYGCPHRPPYCTAPRGAQAVVTLLASKDPMIPIHPVPSDSRPGIASRCASDCDTSATRLTNLDNASPATISHMACFGARHLETPRATPCSGSSCSDQQQRPSRHRTCPGGGALVVRGRARGGGVTARCSME